MDKSTRSEFLSADEDGGVDLNTLKVAELKKLLIEMKLPTTGKKKVLIARITNAKKNSVGANMDADVSSDDDENLSDVEVEAVEGGGEKIGEEKIDIQRAIQMMKESHIKTIKFQDVADTIPSFSGDKGEHVLRWLRSFEATAEMANWNDIEKIINAKRKFLDSAKLFAKLECHAKTRSMFKKELIEEFSETVNTKQVHRQLATSKKKTTKRS